MNAKRNATDSQDDEVQDALAAEPDVVSLAIAEPASADHGASETPGMLTPASASRDTSPLPPAALVLATPAVAPLVPLSTPRGTKRRKDRPLDDCLRFMRAKLESGTFQLDPQDKNSTIDLNGGNAAIQSGSYALELLSCTYGSRKSCFGTVVKDDQVYLWYYDACGIVYTDRMLSLVGDFEDVAAIFIAIADCTPDRFGALPTSIIAPPNPYPQHFPPPSLHGNLLSLKCVGEGEMTVTLDQSVSAQYSLTGRRSFIYTADVKQRSPAATSTRVIVKFSYQVTTRSAEYDILEQARKRGVQHVADIHAWRELWTLTDSTRSSAFRQEKRDNNARKRDLIKKLAEATDMHGFPEYEDRIFRAVVYTEYGSIWTLFGKHFELVPIMVDQMIDCASYITRLNQETSLTRDVAGLHDLRYKANILHRDISINNIMYKVQDGAYYFILIDFDMAVDLTNAVTPDGGYKASSKNRTGTLPFMAYDLVRDAWNSRARGTSWKPLRHLLRHDFESLFYVAFWSITAVRTSSGKDPLQDWLANGARELETGSLRDLAGKKLMLCRSSLKENNIVLPEPTSILKGWFLGWTQVFLSAYSALDLRKLEDEGKEEDPSSSPQPDFDVETVNGLFTRDTLKAALTHRIPALSWKTANQPPLAALPLGGQGASLAETVAPPKSRAGKPSARSKPRNPTAKNPSAVTRRSATRKGKKL